MSSSAGALLDAALLLCGGAPLLAAQFWNASMVAVKITTAGHGDLNLNILIPLNADYLVQDTLVQSRFDGAAFTKQLVPSALQ